MQLRTVHVTNFRSVDDSEDFTVERVTCLVGKNEAGKSAILLALAALNPHPSTPASLDKERDFPRRLLTQYDQLNPDDDAVAVSTTWELDGEEMIQLSDAVGEGTITSSRVRVWRRYGHGVEVGADLDSSKALEHLYARYELDESERAVLSAVGTTTGLITALGGLSSPTGRHASLKAHLDAAGGVATQVSRFVQGLLPTFMYFAAYDRMDGAIQLEQTRTLMASNQLVGDAHRGTRLFAEFLDYAGVSMEEITKVTTYETFNARLQGASNNITDQVMEYWTQNPDLSVSVRVEQAKPGDPVPLNSGTIAWARINNNLHRVDTPFSERSAGFVWFFSFLVKFAQAKDGAPVVLLLDEPGLTLHGTAQADLLRFFKEKLAPHHQIVYSTHSPFMVPADELASVRIVEDKVEQKGHRRVPLGTKVREDVLTRDPDTLFPLQGALGYEISQSLFVGKDTLLVEGPGDILYIQALSDALRRRGRAGLDARWTLCPAGGIDKIRPFVTMFAGNALNVAVLSDQAHGDRRKVEELRRSQVLAAGHFFTMADLLARPEADIEDLFDPALFATILNSTYSLDDGLRLTPERLIEAKGDTQRLVKQAEAAFALMPSSVREFDHFAPASWLIRNPALLAGDDQGVKDTLDRAQNVFDRYNGLL